MKDTRAKNLFEFQFDLSSDKMSKKFVRCEFSSKFTTFFARNSSPDEWMRQTSVCFLSCGNCRLKCDKNIFKITFPSSSFSKIICQARYCSLTFFALSKRIRISVTFILWFVIKDFMLRNSAVSFYWSNRYSKNTALSTLWTTSI